MVLSLVIFFRSGTDFRGAVGRSFLGRSSHRKFPRSEVKPQTPSFAHFALLDLSSLLPWLFLSSLRRFCAILVMMPCQSVSRPNQSARRFLQLGAMAVSSNQIEAASANKMEAPQLRAMSHIQMLIQSFPDIWSTFVQAKID